MTTTLVIVAGAIGASLRFIVAAAVQRALRTEWPWGTAVVNGIGAFLIGLVVGTHPVATVTTVLAGGLAGFTTFSTWMVEAAALWSEGRSGHGRAAIDVLAPLGAGLALTAAGLALGRAL
ncbi:MAG TPA: hypothetical protein DCY40_06010 [Actinobacteria bacterium]|nr:hypothetical protein [Actinomycetota bacterium]